MNIKIDRPQLTSLRLFAALGVLLFHVPFTLQKIFPHSVFSDGNLGVDFFFMLSGFVLAMKYEDGLKLRSYFAKRFARIYPLHILTFVLWILLFFGSWDVTQDEKLQGGWANIFLLQAFRTKDSVALAYNPVSWSLSCEAFFYLLFPFLFTRKKVLVTLLLGYVIAALYVPSPSELEPSGYKNFYYFSPLWRLQTFCVGIFIFQSSNRLFSGELKRPIATILEFFGFAFIFFSIWLRSRLDVSGQFICLWFAPCFAFCLMIFYRGDGIISRALRTRSIVLLGEASFALYMSHHIFFSWMNDRLGESFAGIGSLLVLVGFSIGLSILILKYFELPMKKLILNRLLKAATNHFST